MTELIPFLGHIVVEVQEEDVMDTLRKKHGLENSKLLLPETMAEGKRVPLTKGTIIKLAEDSFGGWFKNKYGELKTPRIGDLIWFKPFSSMPIDEEGKYHLLSEVEIVGYKEVDNE